MFNGWDAKFFQYFNELRKYFSQSDDTSVDDTKDEIFLVFGSLDLLKIVAYEDSAAKLLYIALCENIHKQLDCCYYTIKYTLSLVSCRCLWYLQIKQKI